MRDTLADTGKVDDEIERLTIETETIAIQIQRLISENASTAMDQDDYNRKYDGLVERYNAAENRINDLMKRKETREREAKAMDAFISELSSVGELPIEYSDAVWNALIDKATVYADDRVVFTFKNQKEIPELL